MLMVKFPFSFIWYSYRHIIIERYCKFESLLIKMVRAQDLPILLSSTRSCNSSK